MSALPLSRSLRAVEARVHRSMMLDRLLWKGAVAGSPRFAARTADVARLWAEGPYQAPRSPCPIPELRRDEVTPARFWEASDGLRRPVLIRGFAADIPAVRTWTRERLRARIGHREVTVAWRPPEDRVTLKDARSEQRRLPFADFLDRVSDEPMYLTVETGLFEACPDLLDDLALDRLKASFQDPRQTWDSFIAANLFIGGADMGSAVHCAIGGNFFTNIAGRKRWTLFDPALSAWLHPVAARPFQFAYSAFGGKRVGPLAGLQAPDLWTTLPRFEVTLEAGDVLYNAPWWWHEVENLDRFTIGCANRYVTPPLQAHPTWDNQPLWTALSVYPALTAVTLVNYLGHMLHRSARPTRAWLQGLHGATVRGALER